MTQTVPTALLAFDSGAFGFRNKLINGAFRTNQLAYVSGTALATGVPGSTTGYAHDGWRGGASGCNYTFSQSLGPTTVTVASGTLISAIDPTEVEGGSYVLSWTGTSLARVGINSATPAGTYVASPILITGQTAGTVMSCEFSGGTISKVQMELGAVPTAFEWAPSALQLIRCAAQIQIYGNMNNGVRVSQYGAAGGLLNAHYLLPVQMRAVPTAALNGTWFVSNCSQPTLAAIGQFAFTLNATITALGAAQYATQSAGQNVTLTATL